MSRDEAPREERRRREQLGELTGDRGDGTNRAVRKSEMDAMLAQIARLQARITKLENP